MWVSSDHVGRLYPHPGFLWLACPVVMYWIGRMVIMAERRYLDDEPVLFAVRDRDSLMAFASIAAVVAVAALPR